MQTALDLTVLAMIYLPTFYIFKAGVFSGSSDPSVWASAGLENYVTNFAKDESDLLKVWFPANLVCFSVPLYMRLPVRHIYCELCVDCISVIQKRRTLSRYMIYII